MMVLKNTWDKRSLNNHWRMIKSIYFNKWSKNNFQKEDKGYEQGHDNTDSDRKDYTYTW